MNPRELKMAIGLLALIVLGGGGALGYTFVYSPLEDADAAIDKLNKEIDDTADKQGLRSRVEAMRKAAPEAAIVKRQSLPPTLDVAKTQYKFLLERLLHQAHIENFTSPLTEVIESRAPITPDLGDKKPAYVRLGFKFDIKKTDIWKLADFLQEFYQLDLLHQITGISIVRSNEVTESRSGLDVHLSIEAIILDGAEQKLALFPVVINGKLTSSGQAVAAIGGGLAVQAVAYDVRPEMPLWRKVTALSNIPVLATRPRDYSLLAQNDLFYGVLPDKAPPGLTIAKIPDVEIKEDETKAPDVKVSLSGEGSENATITAKASGSLLPEGPLAFDPNTNTISFPEVNEGVTQYANSTITIVAHSESTGKETKSTFSVKIRRPDLPPPPKDDIASAIRLVMITGSSEGVVSALIQDTATPMKYNVSLDAKNGIKVMKWYLLKPKKQEWRLDRDYEHPLGILAISDDYSSTKKTFKVIAIENDALIVEDLTKLEVKGGGKGGRPGGGWPPAGGGQPPPPKGGPPVKSPINPLAIVGGNFAAAVPISKASQFLEVALAFARGNLVKPPAPPVLYRWAIGKTLKDLDQAKLTPEESRKILQNIADSGVVETPVTAAK